MSEGLILNVSQVAKVLGVSRPTVYRLVESGALPAKKLSTGSDTTARTIDDEIARILLAQEQRAHGLLEKYRAALDAVSETLLEKETMDGADVARVVHESLGDLPAETPASVD